MPSRRPTRPYGRIREAVAVVHGVDDTGFSDRTATDDWTARRARGVAYLLRENEKRARRVCAARSLEEEQPRALATYYMAIVYARARSRVCVCMCVCIRRCCRTSDNPL